MFTSKMLQIKTSRLCLPLYISNFCVCAYWSQLIIGEIEKEELLKPYFEFELRELSSLYSLIVGCAKYFGGLEPTSSKVIFLRKNNSSEEYACAYNCLRQEGEEKKCVSFRLENKDKLQFEITFDEKSFGTLIESLSIVTWHCLGLTDEQINLFISYLEMPITDFLALKDFAKLKAFWKEQNHKDAHLLAQLSRYHFATFLLIYKLNSLVNEDHLYSHIRNILEFC